MDLRRTRVRIIAAVITITVAAAIPWAIARAFTPDTRETASVWAQTPTPTIPQAGELLSSQAIDPVFVPVNSLPLQPLAQGGVSPSNPFLGAYVEGVTQLADGRSMVRIRVPSGVHGEYQAVISGWAKYTYACVVPIGHPDRLYCLGSQLATGVRVSLSLFEIGGGPGRTPVFLAGFYVQSDLPALGPSGSDVHAQPGSSATPTSHAMSATPSLTSTAGPTLTPVPPSATNAPTDTLVPPSDTLPPPTNTSTPLPSDTPVPAPTDTPIPVPTNTPVPVPTDTPVPVPTDTPIQPPTATP